MNVLFVFVATLAVVLAATTYPSTWDNVNVDDILKNDRLLQNYVNCLLDKGKCTPDGEALKKFLPEALNSKCAKCTEKQKQGAVKVVQFMETKKPELWKMLTDKYDPDGIYSKLH